MREYRGKRLDNGEWVYGCLVNNLFFKPETKEPVPYIINPDEYPDYDTFADIEELAVEVDPDTVGQYTGLEDKKGQRIFEGDILRIRRPGRDEQTHYGDNIPLGSYTEPMEPIITEEIVSVIFANGWFGYIQTADRPHYTIDDFDTIPLSWSLFEIAVCNEDELKELFSGNWGSRIFEGWEDDKEYLFETYKVNSIEELINYIGVEVIGNRWESSSLTQGKEIP